MLQFNSMLGTVQSIRYNRDDVQSKSDGSGSLEWNTRACFDMNSHIRSGVKAGTICPPLKRQSTTGAPVWTVELSSRSSNLFRHELNAVQASPNAPSLLVL